MYLTLFGDDWWKYATKIMSRSNKNLAITTTLHDKNNMKYYDYIIGEDLVNQWDYISYMDFNSSSIKIKLWAFDIIYTWKIFNNVKLVHNINNIFSDWIYYIPQTKDSIINENSFKDNSIIINWEKVVDFKNQVKKSSIKLIYNQNLSWKYGVYNIIYNNKKIWDLVFKWKIFPIKNISLSKPISYDIIPWEWSTNWLKAIGISVSQDVPYASYFPNLEINIDDDPWLWFRSNFRNITDFAAWNNVWQSVRPFENELMVNFWDPFIKRISLEKVNPKVWVSKTYWKRIYHNINGWIKKVVSLDFNNDGLKDIVIAYKNKIRILKNYKWYENFENLGNLMMLGKDIKDIFAWDVDGDGYQDLFVVFNDKTIRVYKNHHWEFDVNWTPICLPLPTTDGFHLSYEQIVFRDMNNDKKTDIVVNDYASDINVFFGPTYLSKDKKTCDVNYKSRLVKKHVKSYGMVVDQNKKFADAGYLYYEGMKNDSTLLAPQIKEAFEKKDISQVPLKWNITPSNYLDEVSEKWKDKFAFQPIPRAIWPSFVTWYRYIDFKKITFLSWGDDVKVYKTMKSLDSNTLLPWSKVRVTVHIENPLWRKLTYLEVLKWPFSVISKDNNVILDIKWVSKDKVTHPKWAYREFLFRVDNTNSTNIEISYDAYFQWQSSVFMKVDDRDKNKYWDIKVFIKNWCVKGYDYFQWQPWIPMNFNYSFVNLAKKLKEFNDKSKWFKKIDDIKSDIDSGNYDKLVKEYVDDNEDEDDIYNGFSDMNLQLNLDLNIDISSIKSRVDGILKWLCKWYSFGKSSCSWSPIPCNYAFFAPWIINYCWCPWGIDPWRPIFWWFPPYKTLLPVWIEPIAINSPNWSKSSLRIYLSPTLSMGLWLAVCFGPYKKWMTSPSAPVWAIAWNCVVVAWELSAKCKKNADDTEEEWMEDLWASWICNSLPVETWIYPPTSISSPWFSSFENSEYSSNMLFGVGVNWKPMIQFSASATKINSLADAEQLMKWWEPLNLHTKLWTFKGIISCVIKKWLNHQIQFTISQLTRMTIYVTYPDMSWLMNWFDDKTWSSFWLNGSKLWNMFNWVLNPSSSKTAWQGKFSNILSKYVPSRSWLKNLQNTLNNPFKAVESVFENIPLVNVNYKTVVIKVPWIWKDEIDRQISYLKTWMEDNKPVLNASASVDARKFYKSIQNNIKILEEYKKFPLKLYKYLHALDFYLDQIMCIIKTYIKLVVWWLNTQSKIFEKWVDAIIALINIFRTWQLLIDVSVNWKSSCWKCRQDTGDLYDCTLTWLCPSLPVLPIPPFRLPDIFIDFTHIDLGINIVLPRIKIRPVPIWLFTLPSLPYGWLNVKVKLPKLPTLPKPPELPDLPWLPPFPTIELPNLPPPPKIPNLVPALRVALNVFKIVGYFRCIIKNWIWLVAEWNVKTRIEQLTARHNRLFPFDFINIDFPELPFKWFDVKVDWYLRLRVEMDQLYKAVKSLAKSINKKTKPMIGEMQEINLKVNSKTQEYDMWWTNVDVNVDVWNKESEKIDNKFRKIEEQWQKKVDEKWKELKEPLQVEPVQKDLFNFYSEKSKYEFVVNKKPVSSQVARKLLASELNAFIWEKHQWYLSSLSNEYFDRAKTILHDTEKPTIVKSNVKEIKQIENEISKLVNKQHLQIYKVKNIIKKMENGEKVDFNNDIFVKNNNLVSQKNEDKTIVFTTSLFSTDKNTLNIIKNSKSPRQNYIEMYSKLLWKVESKVNKFKKKQPKYIKLLPKINATKYILTWIWNKYSYAKSASSTKYPVITDPSQTIRWLYMEWTDDIYYNVMSWKQKAEKIRRRHTYFFDDINNDGLKDLIWYDKYSVYIKYSNDKKQDNGSIIWQHYIYPTIIKDFKDIVDKKWYLHLNWSEFKLIDKVRPINNLKVVWNTFTRIKLTWRRTDPVNAYLIVYTSRVDILNDIEKDYNYSPDFTYYGNNYKTYGIVVYDRSLTWINEITTRSMIIDWHKVFIKKFIDKDLKGDNYYHLYLNKDLVFLNKKWKYFRIYNANIENNEIKVISSYSNQDLWWTQINADIDAPMVTPILIRKKTWKVVWTWARLLAYLNTEYILKAIWEDDVGIKKKYITDANFHKLVDGDTLYISPKRRIQYRYYYLVWEDYNGNIRKRRVVITFTVPRIKLVKVNPELWKLFSKIWHDMDKTAVKFAAIYGNNVKIISNLSGKVVFKWWVWKVDYTGAIFDNRQLAVLYNRSQEKIWYLDLDKWLLLIDRPYYVLWTVTNWLLYYSVYNPEWLKIFSIYLPSIKLIKAPEMLNTWKYELRRINNPNMKVFNWGYCLYNKENNICAMYISLKGNIYVDQWFRNKFIFDYNAELWNITTTIYDASVPNQSQLTPDKKILYYIFKPKSLIHK